jgi:hypothetical protein
LEPAQFPAQRKVLKRRMVLFNKKAQLKEDAVFCRCGEMADAQDLKIFKIALSDRFLRLLHTRVSANVYRSVFNFSLISPHP